MKTATIALRFHVRQNIREPDAKTTQREYAIQMLSAIIPSG